MNTVPETSETTHPKRQKTASMDTKNTNETNNVKDDEYVVLKKHIADHGVIKWKNTVSYITYKRTYARRLNDDDPESDTEELGQTLFRIIRACNEQLGMNLSPEEQCEYFDIFANFKALPAGRFLWQLGTRTVDRYGLLSLQNCAFTQVDSFEAFCWVFDCLMLGCVPPNSPVLTNKGIVEIKDIDVGDKVWSWNTKFKQLEYKPVTRVHDVIVKQEDNIKITGRYGHLVTSKKHPLLVRRDGEWGYVKAGEIELGDIIQRYNLVAEPKFHNKAWFVGCFLGDGSSKLQKYGGRHIRINGDNESVISAFTDSLKELSGEEFEYKLDTDKRYNVPVWKMEKTLNKKNKVSLDWKNMVGDLPTSKTKEVEIPMWIKTSYDKNVFMSFLCGLIDSDGYISDKSKLHYCTSSLQMKEDLEKYCPLYGMYPWITTTTPEDYKRYEEKGDGKNGFTPTCNSYVISFSMNEFVGYEEFIKHDLKQGKIKQYLANQNRNVKKELIVPEDKITEELEKLKLRSTEWHFTNRIRKYGYVQASTYTRKGLSTNHLNNYDVVCDIEDNLDITENFKDITVQDNNSYVTGFGSYYTSHNSGTGYNIQRKYTDKLPKPRVITATRQDTKDADFIVPDSREGWIELLRYLLKAHFTEDFCEKGEFTYSTVCLRSKGAPIKGFGGTASGSEHLCTGITDINKLINSRASEGLKLRPIDCLDVMNLVARTVISGNVRRCLPKGTLVHTTTGLVPIEKMTTDHKVQTHKGVFEVSAVVVQGYQELLCIETELGYFKCTRQHKMAVWSNEDAKFLNKYVWKQAFEIDPNTDRLVHVTQTIEGVETKIDDISHAPKMNSDTAYFLGYCHGNLSSAKITYGNNDKKKEGMVHFHYNNFLDFIKPEDFKFSLKLREEEFIIESDSFAKHMDSIRKTGRIPHYILNATKELRTSYLDGFVKAKNMKNNTILNISNNVFLYNLQSLYASLGIQSIADTIHHKLCIVDKSYFGQSWVEYFYPTSVVNPVKITNICMIYDTMETYDITVEQEHEFVAGGGFLTHNSAQIAIGDSDDKEYLNAKRWDKGNIPNWRCFSNNSVVCDDIKNLPEEFWEGYKGNGECYGLINLDLSQKIGRTGETQYPDPDVTGYNPSLRAGTRVLTSDGVVPIEKLENKFFKTRNLNGGWSYARCWKSGTDKPLHKLTMANGKEYYCTAEHKWPVLKTVEPTTTSAAPTNVTIKKPTLPKIEKVTEEMGNVSVDDLKKSEEKIQQAYNAATASKTPTEVRKTVTRTLTTDIKAKDRLPYVKSIALCHPKDGVGSYTDGFCIALLYCSPTTFVADGDLRRHYIWVLPESFAKGDFGSLLTTWMNDVDHAAIRTFEQKDNKGTKFVVITQQSKGFSEHMSKFGVTSEQQVKDKAYGVPQAVWTGSEDFRRGFIDGLYSYVGGVDDKQGLAYIPSVSETFVRDLWDLFGFYGVASTIKVDQKREDGTVMLPLVVFEGDVFSQLFQVTDKEKQEKLDKLEHKKQDPVGEIEVTSCELTELKEDVWDVAVYDTAHMFALSHCFTGNCGEQSLANKETCVSGDTRVHTLNGVFYIKDLVGKEVSVYNGEEWSKVTPFLAKDEDEYLEIRFSDGSLLKATPYHEFSAATSSQNKQKKLRADELKVGMFMPKLEMPAVDGDKNELAYTIGAFLGDGYVDNSGNKAMICAVEQTKDKLFENCKISHIGKMWKDEERKNTMYRGRVDIGDTDFELWKDMRNYDTGLPDYVMSFGKQSILDLVAGWVDTDGSIRNEGAQSEGFIICGGFENKLRDLQILLRRAGINFSRLRLQNKIGDETNYGTRNKNIWILQIPSFECGDIPTKLKLLKNIGNRTRVNPAYPDGKKIDQAGRQKIISIEKCDEKEPSYCFSEPLKHMGVFGNVLTYQCCLMELFLPNMESQEDMFNCAKQMYRIAKHSMSLPCHQKATEKIVHKNMRMGIGITGVLQAPEKMDWLNKTYEQLRAFDEQYSKEHGFPPSVKLTTVKPSGCVDPMTVIVTDTGDKTVSDIFKTQGITLPNNSEATKTWYPVTSPFKVLDEYNNMQNVVKLYDNGVDDTVKVQINGEDVVCTTDHKFKVGNQWTKAIDLKAGDIVKAY